MFGSLFLKLMLKNENYKNDVGSLSKKNEDLFGIYF